MRPGFRFASKLPQGGAVLPRPVLWIVAGLSLGAGVLGYSTGRSVANLTETEAITVYAHIYAQQTGGKITDCAAVPGDPPVWLVIRCDGGAASRIFRVTRDGTLLSPGTGPSA